MKTMSLRSLARQAPDLREPVIVTHRSRVIGEFIPVTKDGPKFAPARSPRRGEV